VLLTCQPARPRGRAASTSAAHRSETQVRSGSTNPPPQLTTNMKTTAEATKDQTSKTTTAHEPRAAKAKKATPAGCLAASIASPTVWPDASSSIGAENPGRSG
jgi:hypothetical protein